MFSATDMPCIRYRNCALDPKLFHPEFSARLWLLPRRIREASWTAAVLRRFSPPLPQPDLRGVSDLWPSTNPRSVLECGNPLSPLPPFLPSPNPHLFPSLIRPDIL